MRDGFVMTARAPILKSLLLLTIFLSSLFAVAIQSPTEPNLDIEVVESTSGGSRHLYTFSDGSSEAIALYQSGTPARNIQVSMPRGAEVTGAELTISGASATGWNSLTDTSRADWTEGTPISMDTRGESVTLSFKDSQNWFQPHDSDSAPASTNAWYDNTSYSIRQPHTTNVSETRFSSQLNLASGTMATYNSAAFVYRLSLIHISRCRRRG